MRRRLLSRPRAWILLLLAVALMAVDPVRLGPAVRASGAAGASLSLSYLALPPVRRWDVDLIYRYERLDRHEVSAALGYDWRGRERVQELAVALRGRLGPRDLGVFRLPLTHWRAEGRGWRVGPGGWERFEGKERGLWLQPVTIGWRREATWFHPDDAEWGVDAVLGGAPGWVLVPQGRWVWVRDPILLGVEVAVPWYVSGRKPPAGGGGKAAFRIDHAVNRRLVLSSGLAWGQQRLAFLWGWSIQLRPDHYWNLQVEWPAGRQAFTVQSGWRFRL